MTSTSAEPKARSATPGPEAVELRSAGMRVTPVRVATLKALADLPHSDAETVLARVRADLGSVSVQAIYDVLHALSDAGLVQGIEPAGHPTRYERRTGDNHHHAVCRVCGTVADVDCAVGAAPCLAGSDDQGFQIESAEVIYWGTCSTCAT